MSIQASINQSLGTLGIAAGLYQQTPSYKHEQEVKQAKTHIAGLKKEKEVLLKNILEIREGWMNQTPEQQGKPGSKESYEARLKSYQDQTFDIERQIAGYQEMAEEYDLAAKGRAKVAGMEARRRVYAQQQADRAVQLKTEQRDAVQARLAQLEGFVADVRGVITAAEQRKGGNK